MEAGSVEFFTLTGIAILSVSIYGIIDKVLICGYMYLSRKNNAMVAFEYLGYQFDGAYRSPDFLEPASGVYVVWCENGGMWTVLDVGEANDVKERIKNHDRADCWEQNCAGTIYYSATFTPNLQQEGRIDIEKRVRNLTNPPCGRR